MKRLVALLALTVTLCASAPASATNGYWGSWRRWPWRNTTKRILTQVGGHEYASRSARKAIDIAMDHEAVYSVLGGVVDHAGNDSGAGTYLRVRADDGTYYTYEHLDSASASRGQLVWLGDLVATSGNSGRSSAAHLHVQRAAGPSFDDEAVSLTPISGIYEPIDGDSYVSDNAAIGTTSGGSKYGALRRSYDSLDGYARVGVPVAIPVSWMPCRSDGVGSTRWMYACADGWAQTFMVRDDFQALLAKQGTTTAYLVTSAFLRAYTQGYQGSDWIHRLGFPTANAATGSSAVTQRFENGQIRVSTSPCATTVSGPATVTYQGWC